jgi:hypothetical protein
MKKIVNKVSYQDFQSIEFWLEEFTLMKYVSLNYHTIESFK